MSKKWCFTINNPTELEEEAILLWDSTYCIYQFEIGENGTRHIQGYVVFNANKRLTGVRQLNARAHWEIAMGSTEANVAYCTKDDTREPGTFPIEIGVQPVTRIVQGLQEKARWDQARAAAVAGRFDDIPSDIFLRHYRTIKEVHKDNMLKPPDIDNVTGVWLHGPSGCGKSRSARQNYPNAYLKMCNKWWDGYQDEENVIIDDFDPVHAVLAHHLKIWADRYAFLAETKGGAIAIRPGKIVITSQYSIEQIWPDEPTREALNRRFQSIHMGGYIQIQRPLGPPGNPDNIHN